MQTASAFLRLSRPDSTILAFLAVFVPVAVRTRDLLGSLSVAFPMLFVAICTFIVNDIDDIECDKINHPQRPLPSGHVLLPFATAIYFVCLALALFTIKMFVPGKAAFLYYVLLFTVISYSYITEHLPNYKSPYVASACSLPIFITINLVPRTGQLYLVAFATFFFVLGRELLLDYMDKSGDPESFVGKLSRRYLTLFAFASASTGLILLSPLARQSLDVLILCFITTLVPLSLYFWLNHEQPRMATGVMKLQMYAGLYFLCQP